MKKKKVVKPVSLIIPCATVFIAGACIMILEIVAGRLIAKYLGATLYVWTSVIGVVLGGITIGNYVGGRIADTYPANKILAILFGVSSVMCVCIVILNNLVGQWTFLWQLPWPVRVLTHVALVFLLPSALLGTISPVVAKMALDAGHAKGDTIGKIYAWSAGGSILGTLVAGFFLISLLGTTAIIWIIGALLLIIGILYFLKSWVLYAWAGLFVLLLLAGTVDAGWAAGIGESMGLREKRDKNILYEDESEYCYIAVEQLSKDPDKRRLRQDDLESHSMIIMDDITNLQYPYTKIFAAVTHVVKPEKEPLSLLSIGGGGYVFPRYALAWYPGSVIDVAEIDPGVTEAAIRAFGLDRETPINTINVDGRIYVNELYEKQKLGKAIQKYDLIYGDAFGNSFVPFQLVTKECNDRISSLLADDGVYIINLLDTYQSSRLLGAVINTMQQTFPRVYVVSTYEAAAVGRNFLIIGSKKEIGMERIWNEEQAKDLSLWIFNKEEIDRAIRKAGRLLLVDDYAPVEQLLSPMVFLRSNYFYAKKFILNGDRYTKKKEWRSALSEYEKAIQHCPGISIVAFSRMSQVYADTEQWDEVISTGERAIEYNEKSEGTAGVSLIHYNIGLMRFQQGRNDEGMEHMYKAIDGLKEDLGRRPGTDTIYFSLGDAYAYTGDFKNAIPAFRQAVELNKIDTKLRLSLVTALMKQKQYDEAKEVLLQGIRILEDEGITDKAGDLQEFLDTFEEKKKEYL